VYEAIILIVGGRVFLKLKNLIIFLIICNQGFYICSCLWLRMLNLEEIRKARWIKCCSFIILGILLMNICSYF
jgi:hypothetical protein